MIIFDTTPNLDVVEHPSRTPDIVNNVGDFHIATYDVSIYNKSTRETTVHNGISGDFYNGVATFVVPITGVEGVQYYMTVTEGDSTNKLLFNSNLLCTDQTDLQDYEITKGDYVEPTQTNNEFITY